MLERFEEADGLVGYRSPLLAELGVAHLFTTRRGGAVGELDLAGDAPEQLARVLRVLGSSPGASPELRIVRLRQVHGARVLEVGDGDEEAGALAREGDGLVTERRDRVLAVHTADCVPVLLAREDGARVAAVHAGWRGLVAGVLERAVEVLRAPRGGELVAAIGPCLSTDRFEVGPEVAAAFAGAGLGEAVRPAAPGAPRARPHVDLRGAAALALRRAGVRRLDTSERCTWDDAGDFFSYRRDVTHGGRPRTGRLAALIAPR